MRRTEIARNWTMSTAAIVDLTRGMASALVDRAERDTRSRMLAYQRVAGAVGVSASWIRKFIAGKADAKRVSLVTGLTIIDNYRRLCARIEAEAATEREKHEAIMRQLDAAAGSNLEMVAGAPASEARGTGTAQADEVSEADQ